MAMMTLTDYEAHGENISSKTARTAVRVLGAIRPTRLMRFSELTSHAPFGGRDLAPSR